VTLFFCVAESQFRADHFDALGGAGAVAPVEGVAQASERSQALGQFNRRPVGETSQHHVVERVQLIDQRGADGGVVVPEQVDPPGADRIQMAPASVVAQPHSWARATGISGSAAPSDACSFIWVQGCQTPAGLR
jgi:hypothetical protein